MKLGVNVDHVATLREARGSKNPDPVLAAKVCESAGAHSIVMHLREDRRHIKDSDLFRVKEVLKIKLNMEMALAPSVIKTAARLCPDQVTLVPERRRERTTESGLDVVRGERKIRRSLEIFRKKNIAVSLFIDPEPKQIEFTKKLGVEAVEFHTGAYANERSKCGMESELKRLSRAAALARDFKITTHAGHGLDYENVKPLTKIEGFEEFNIGYSLICRALWVGLEQAVKEMKALL
jgi:pyridoxine 5-phosphate synthase